MTPNELPEGTQAYKGKLEDVETFTYLQQDIQEGYSTIFSIMTSIEPVRPGPILTPLEKATFLDLKKDEFAIILFGGEFYTFLPDENSDNLVMGKFFDHDPATTEAKISTLIKDL